MLAKVKNYQRLSEKKRQNQRSGRTDDRPKITLNSVMKCLKTYNLNDHDKFEKGSEASQPKTFPTNINI